MLFFVDASCPRLLVARLRELGHEVDYAIDIAPGATDAFWAERATRLRQVIVSQDYDFSQLAETGRAPFGVLQIAPMRGALADRVERVIEAIIDGAESLIGATTTVETHRVRRRVLVEIDSLFPLSGEKKG